jgi:hypothetical protein
MRTLVFLNALAFSSLGKIMHLVDYHWRAWSNTMDASLSFSWMCSHPNCPAQNNWPTLQSKFGANNWVCCLHLPQWRGISHQQMIALRILVLQLGLQVYSMACFSWSYTMWIKMLPSYLSDLISPQSECKCPLLDVLIHADTTLGVTPSDYVLLW